MDLTVDMHERILRQMLRIRHFEENLYQMYLAKQVPGMSPHLSVGQEAVAVGVCSALEQKDYVLTTHRGHGHVLAKGANMNRMLAEILGKETGYCHGRGGSMHIADVSLNIIGANGIVGGGLPIAVGSGLSSKLLNKNAVTVCFFGDAASNIGTFHESLNMAAIWKLPVVWVCENNQYGLSTSIKDMLAGGSVANRGTAYGMPGYTIDGNDVLAVYETALKAVNDARRDRGPSIIEARTYRWYGHGASDNRSYRSREEENEWKTKCPVARYSQYLSDKGILTKARMDAIEKETQDEVRAAIRFSSDSPLPEPASVCDYIFSELL
jgi:TPP-dependent pyruvate/acetoin dehydrogenase alpha subunit